MAGESVLITGAGTGLGLETAVYLARQGFNVFASVYEDGQREHVESREAKAQVTLNIIDLDILNRDSIQEAVQTVLGQHGRIDALVNNAGISLRGYFEDCEEAEIRRTVEVNLFGTMAVTRAVLPYMRAARRGHLVFVSSVGGRIGSMARTAYCASKFGLEGFAESLMQEVMPFGLKVSLVEPGLVDTERWTVHRGLAKGAMNPNSPYYEWFCRQEKLADQLVQSSGISPDDVARTIYQALTADRPRLRYVVGRRTSLILALRRYIPGEIFERLYFSEAMRRVTGSRNLS